MLIICDFDGTATEIEPLEYLAHKYAPGSAEQYQRLVESSDGSVHAVMAAGLAESNVGAEMLVSTLVAGVPLREGFREFCAAVQRDGHRLYIVSAGFSQLIVPLMRHGGVFDVEVVANDIKVNDDGSLAAQFRELPTCEICGETCKRSEIARLRAGTDELVVMIGDGISDRCAAINDADIVYATGLLPGFLDVAGVPYHQFETFTQVLDHMTSAAPAI